MWDRYLAAVATATLLGAAGVAVPASIGTPQGAPILGDLNSDGVTDRITLGSALPDACQVTVERGRPGGGYRPPRVRTYPNPSGTQDYCPDLGTIVDLGGDGVAELVLAWFHEAPLDLDYDMMVLRNFVPAGGFPGITQPGRMGSADFNGDGLQDVFQWTEQGGGFASYLNTPEGDLVAGPVRFPSICITDVGMKLDDFHRTGGRGLLLWYDTDCMGTSGVSVVGHNGIRVDLERDPFGEQRWLADTLDANGDQIPDVRTDNRDTGEVTHFIGTGYGRFVESPRPVFDRAVVSPRRRSVIRILDNDYATAAARVTITVPAAFGRVRVNPDRTVTYVPLSPHDGGDRFVYRIDQDGKRKSTPVKVRFTD